MTSHVNLGGVEILQSKLTIYHSPSQSVLIRAGGGNYLYFLTVLKIRYIGWEITFFARQTVEVGMQLWPNKQYHKLAGSLLRILYYTLR